MWAMPSAESEQAASYQDEKIEREVEGPVFINPYVDDKDLEEEMDLETEAAMMERIAELTRTVQDYDGRNITFMV